MNEILAALAPHLIEIAVTAAVSAITIMAGKVTGKTLDKDARETLHSALTTAASTIVGRGLSETEAVGAIIEYAKQSSPGSIKRLKPSETVLLDLALSKLAQQERK